ncbi:MAG TPA: serine hydrolase [Acidimicrobiia bacterium]
MDEIDHLALVSNCLARRGLAIAVFLVAFTACGDSADTTTTPPPLTTSTTAPTTTSEPTTTSTATPAPAEVQTTIDWFVSILNGEELTEAEYDSRFSEKFRQQVPFTTGFQPVLDKYRPEAPFTVLERSGDMRRGEAIIESADGNRARVLAELDEGNRLSGLVIQPADQPSLDDPPDTIRKSFSRLAEMGTLRATAAEVVDGECRAIEGSAAKEPTPLGSVFKLYVLAALGDAVRGGDLAWGDEIVIKDELKSVPSGVLHDRPSGERITVLEAAELMISISDNTATDHLIDLIGRQRVESALTEYGNTTAELNTPLLNTREFTALKVGPASGLSIQWLEGDEETRRSILTQISDITPGDLPIQEWVEPIQPDQLEWFASPDDLCRLAVGLLDLTDSVPEIGHILAMNPGIPGAPGRWDTIWFKGGFEPGLAAGWFVTSTESRTFVTAGSVVNPEATLDTEEAILLFAAARDLLSTR